MKFKQLQTLSVEEREKKLVESKKELLKLNGQVITGTAPKSPGQIKELKKTIAKLKVLSK
jgi:ribosomal protein L29